MIPVKGNDDSLDLNIEEEETAIKYSEYKQKKGMKNKAQEINGNICEDDVKEVEKKNEMNKFEGEAFSQEIIGNDEEAESEQKNGDVKKSASRISTLSKLERKLHNIEKFM